MNSEDKCITMIQTEQQHCDIGDHYHIMLLLYIKDGYRIDAIKTRSDH